MYKICFDNDLYLQIQSKRIRERIAMFGEKLYLEFGGKLFDDYHASRVLPGFHPDSKIKMLTQFKDDVEIIIAINASAIEKSKIRGDLSITYDQDVLRLIDAFRGYGLYVGSVVLTQFFESSKVLNFKNKLETLGVKVYKHYFIEGYPSDVQKIVSEDGFGKNEYIETSKPLVVVTAPGPGSGKMATCLSQVYHDFKKGIRSGYAKFETFPVWNLSISHPVNIAYEAATVDLNDMNLIDPYHMETYGVLATNYNRDVEIFPVLSRLLSEVSGGKCPYKSPTDMGVNTIGNCIIDNEAACNAARKEIIRRYYHALCEQKKGIQTPTDPNRIRILMNKANIDISMRKTVGYALRKAEETGGPAVAIELPNGQIVTGKTSSLLGACSSALLNALKTIANIPDELEIIAKEVLEPIQTLKLDYLGNHNPRLHTDEILIALSISALSNENAKKGFNALKQLVGSEVHSTVILSAVDEAVFTKLGCYVTCEPVYQSKKLFHN